MVRRSNGCDLGVMLDVVEDVFILRSAQLSPVTWSRSYHDRKFWLAEPMQVKYNAAVVQSASAGVAHEVSKVVYMGRLLRAFIPSGVESLASSTSTPSNTVFLF